MCLLECLHRFIEGLALCNVPPEVLEQPDAVHRLAPKDARDPLLTR
jgi:hypothetical protein